MAVLASVPSGVRPAGERTFGPANLPTGITEIKATFTREAWPLTNQDVIFQVGIEASLDGGATWPYGCYNFNKDTGQGGWVGGTRTNRLGQTVTQESVQFTGIPEPTNPNRQV